MTITFSLVYHYSQFIIIFDALLFYLFYLYNIIFCFYLLVNFCDLAVQQYNKNQWINKARLRRNMSFLDLLIDKFDLLISFLVDWFRPFLFSKTLALSSIFFYSISMYTTFLAFTNIILSRFVGGYLQTSTISSQHGCFHHSLPERWLVMGLEQQDSISNTSGGHQTGKGSSM